MKALTVCEPYSSLIASGIKKVENRTWPTNYRGLLAIHAGKSRAWLKPKPTEHGWVDADYGIPIAGMPFGCIVAVAQLSGCVEIEGARNGVHRVAWPWLATHEHAEGPWCWVLKGVVKLPEPIPFRGAQGLWNVPPDLLAKIKAQANYEAIA